MVSCCASFSFLEWNCGISWNNYFHEVPFRNHSILDKNFIRTKSKRSDINEKQVLHLVSCFTGENSCLNCCTISYSFVCIKFRMKVLSVEEVFDYLLYFWNTSRSSYHDNIVNLAFFKAGISQNIDHWTFYSI